MATSTMLSRTTACLQAVAGLPSLGASQVRCSNAGKPLLAKLKIRAPLSHLEKRTLVVSAQRDTDTPLVSKSNNSFMYSQLCIWKLYSYGHRRIGGWICVPELLGCVCSDCNSTPLYNQLQEEVYVPCICCVLFFTVFSCSLAPRSIPRRRMTLSASSRAPLWRNSTDPRTSGAQRMETLVPTA